MNRKSCARAAVALSLVGIPVNTAFAQTFPVKSVRIIVPGAPGSSTDVLARLVGQKLTEKWQQPVVIDNRAGAGGTVGAEMAARATPDGYTVLLINAGFAVSAALYKKLSYDSVKDFTAVGIVATQPLILVVNPALPVTSVQELIALAKSKPDQITFGSPGNGSIGHLAAEMFKWKTQTRMLHVPYKGVSPAVTALLSGEVQALFPGIVPVLPHVKTGRLRALAVSTARRATAAPDVPSLAEAGVPGYNESNWQALLAPAGTPPAIVRKFNADVADVLQSADVQKSLGATGTDVVTSGPLPFSQFLAAEIAKWRKLVKDSGARVD